MTRCRNAAHGATASAAVRRRETDRRRTPTRPPTGATGTLRLVWTPEEVRALGVTTDVVTAGRILGLSRNTAYRLARAGAFPVPVLRAGAQYRVPVAGLLTALALDAERDTAAG